MNQMLRPALLVIDMQNDFLQDGAILEVPGIRNNLDSLKTLIAACRKADVPVIYTCHVFHPVFNPVEREMFPELMKGGLREGTDGVNIYHELQPQPGDVVLRKQRYDAFFGTSLDNILHSIRNDGPVATLIISGTVTNICCESTARSAAFRDYRIIFGSDVTYALHPEHHKATLESIRLAFGRVMTAKQIAAALAG